MLRAGLVLTCLAISTTAFADPYIVGNRYFVPSNVVDDPFVADEISTSVTRIRSLPADASPAVDATSFGWGFAKRITPDLGIELDQGYDMLAPTGQKSVYGFDDLKGSIKYQLYVDPDHEFLLSAGLQRTFGGTGANRIDDSFGTTQPTVYFGKGLGDLPDAVAWLRPLAVTGVVDYQIPDRHDPTSPRLLEGGVVIEYSLRYLEGNVRYLALPEFVDRLTPIVEIDYTTPVSHASGVGTMGYIAPGLIYTGNGFDVGAEALIPATHATGTNVGVLASLHLRLDVLMSDTVGRPLIASFGR